MAGWTFPVIVLQGENSAGLLVWLGQAGVIVLVGAATEQFVLPSIIAGVFLLANTVVTYVLTQRRDRRDRRPDDKDSAGP